MKAYSMDLRERVLADCDGGIEARQVAVKHRVSESWIRRLKQRRRETGETAPRPCRNRQGAKGLAHADRIKELVGCQPDVTLRELAERLGHALSGQTLARALRALGLTLKKSSARRRAGSTRRGAASPLVATLATRLQRPPHRVPR
jgi:transposase